MRVAKSRVQIEDLASRMAACDEQAYVEFADTFGPRLRAYFIRRGLRGGDADDLAVSCLTDVALKIDKYTPIKPGGFEAWVFTLAYHFLVDWIRDRPNTQPLPDNLSAPGEVDPVEPNFQLILAVQEALRQLAESDRRIIELRHFGAAQGYSEIATSLQISEGTARVRHFRALDRLEKILKKDPIIIDFLKRNERGES